MILTCKHLLIHPVIYGIAVRLFYTANRFLIDLDGDHGLHMCLGT